MMKTAHRSVIDEKIEQMFHELVRKINAYIDNDVFCCTIVIAEQDDAQVDVIDNIIATDTEQLKEAIMGRTKIFEDEILDAISKISHNISDIN